MAKETWHEGEIRGLGARTDLRTACDILGMGHTAGYRMAKNGTFPVPLIKVGRSYVVPVAHLLDLLGLSRGSEMAAA
ncbi:AlpA family transcriptional regulator [Parafrankia sp. BMG5.11]|uniref:helix-turn-helix transcriptional regulator n=1 Tax=Parafrankia sp. BMG5.11 TaxID=222540 RepID=UPI001A9E9BE0|nr:DNA-binding protein [Parafrankia sp. BMG5.11]